MRFGEGPRTKRPDKSNIDADELHADESYTAFCARPSFVLAADQTRGQLLPIEVDTVPRFVGRLETPVNQPQRFD